MRLKLAPDARALKDEQQKARLNKIRVSIMYSENYKNYGQHTGCTWAERKDCREN